MPNTWSDHSPHATRPGLQMSFRIHGTYIRNEKEMKIIADIELAHRRSRTAHTQQAALPRLVTSVGVENPWPKHSQEGTLHLEG